METEKKYEKLIDFKAHLQKVLDDIATDTFVVSDTRDMVGKTNKVCVVITPLNGSVYENSARVPYKVDVFTDKPNEVQSIFTFVAKQRNSQSFIEVVDEGEESKEYTVFEFYSTPAPAERQLEFGTNVYVRLEMIVDLNILFEVGNISSIKIDGEDIKLLTGSLNYVAEMFSNRKTGDNLNGAKKKASTTNVQFLMINKVGFFTNKIMLMAFNKLSGDTNFNVEVALTTGFKGTLKMKVTQAVLNFAKSSPNLPTLNVTLTFGDNR